MPICCPIISSIEYKNNRFLFTIACANEGSNHMINVKQEFILLAQLFAIFDRQKKVINWSLNGCFDHVDNTDYVNTSAHVLVLDLK